jgi:hypothetical protein
VNGDRPAVRVYGALLGLYPRTFRDEYGADMVQLVRDQCADEPAWRVFGRAALDLAITIPAQQLETHMNRPSTHVVPLLYTALAAAGVLCAMIGGSNAVIVVVGLCAAVVAGTTAAIAWRRTGPVGGNISTDGWWKLVLAGPCIIAAVIVAAGFGVDAWMLGMLAVLVALVLTGTGVLLGIAHLAKRHSRAIPT